MRLEPPTTRRSDILDRCFGCRVDGYPALGMAGRGPPRRRPHWTEELLTVRDTTQVTRSPVRPFGGWVFRNAFVFR
jgi:hypothetical protein